MIRCLCLISLSTLLLTSLPAEPRLQVNATRDALEYRDGRPFIWLGDTAWELFHRTTREDAEHYLQHRAAHGYTLIQAVVLAEIDGLRDPNRYGEVPLLDLNPETPNERYFEHVDYVVSRAQELGLFVGLLPTWGDKVPNANPGAGPVVFNPRNAYTFGKFLGQRYRDRPIVWILGGDRNVDSLEALEIWRAMARGLREGDEGRHLITYHPRGEASSAYWLHPEPWLDFHLYQSSHARRYNPVQRFARLRHVYLPLKPTIDAEPAYEDIPLRFWEYGNWNDPERGVLDQQGLIQRREHFAEGYFTAHDVRVHGYWNFLSGAAGYTYGHNAIWQMWQPGTPIAIPCFSDWRTALDQPGSKQIAWMRRLLERFPPGSFEPNQALIYGVNHEGPNYLAAAVARDGRFALAYSATGRPLPVRLDALRGTMIDAEWYDPRDGSTHPAGTHAVGEVTTFEPPTSGGDQDWLLVLVAR
jgi:hypothetical protein